MDSLFDTIPFIPKKTPLKESFNTKRPIAAKIAEASLKMVWPDNYFVVDQKNISLGDIANHIDNAQSFIFDLETSGLNPWRDDVLCMSIYVEGKAFLIPFDHKMMKCVHPDEFRKALKPYFIDPDVVRMNHNIKFDGHFVRERLKTPVGKFFCDTMLQAWVIDPTSEHGLKELCGKYLISESTGNYSAQFGKTSWAYITPKLAAYYACKDVELVHALYNKQCEVLDKKPKLKSLFWDVEMPVLNEAFEMERQGVLVDGKYVDEVLRPQVYTEYDAAAKAMEPHIAPHLDLFDDSPTVIDVLESPKRLYQVFFERLGVPELKGVTLLKHPKTKEFTKRTLDKNAIAHFRHKFDCMKRLGEYRKVATVKKMFVDQLPDLVTDGCIHPNINTIGADTGRMSMNSPNLQQIPSRMGPLVRNMFIPRPGNVFGSMDFDGQEMRIQAHFSLSGKLVDFYINAPNLDIYSQTAVEVMPDEDFDKFDNKGLTKTAFSEMSKDERKKTVIYGIFKSLVLGLGYGMGPKKFAAQTGIPEKEAVRIYTLYFLTYPELKAYQRRAIAFAEKNGYIVTLLGRERPLPFINSFDKKWKGQDERAAMNTPIQGSAADQVKLAMIKSMALVRDKGWPVRIALVVHDEIIFEFPAEWVKTNRPAIESIREALTTALPLIVPMKSSVTIESRWGTETDLDKLEALEEVA